MSGVEGNWNSSHWQQAGSGGRQASGRSGSNNSDYKRSQQHYRDQQYDDRLQQGHFQGERGHPLHGQHQGRPYGNYAQQHEGFPTHHPDQRRQVYLQHEQRGHHRHAGFGGPAGGAPFNLAEGRPDGFMQYHPESMMAIHTHIPEHWPGGPVPPPSYQHPAQFGRPAPLIDPPQYPLPQPYMQHQGHQGHQGGGIGMGAAGVAAMPGSGYHPNNLRGPQRPGAWGSGAPLHDYRQSDAAIGVGGGPGRGGGGFGRGGGGPGQGGGSGRGGAMGGEGAGSGAARKPSRAPPVPQPLAPNASSQSEPVLSGVVSLGRPRQRPSSTVNNVQSARGVLAEAVQVSGPEDGASNEGGPVGAASHWQADSTVNVEPAPAAEAARPTAGAKAELCEPGAGDQARPMALATADAGPDGAAATGALESGSTRLESAPPARVMTANSTGSCSLGTSSNHPVADIISEVLPTSAPRQNSAEMGGGGPAHPDAQKDAITEPSSAVAPATLSSLPVVPPGSPQRDAAAAALGASQAVAEKLPMSGGGRAWRQGPATALFAAAGSAAGGHVPAEEHTPGRRTNAPSVQGATAPQNPPSGASLAAAGTQPATAAAVTASASTGNGGPHQINAPASSAADGGWRVPSLRIQNKPAHYQVPPRCPPPGFDATIVASGDPSGTDVRPSGSASSPPETVHVPHAQTQPQPQQRQQHAPLSQQPRLSPRTSAGSDTLEPAGLGIPHARPQQHTPAAAAVPASSPSPADAAGAPNKPSSWAALVTMQPTNSGGAQVKSLPTRPPRPMSGGGSSDAPTVAATATFVADTAQGQLPSAAPGTTVASAAPPATAAPAVVPALAIDPSIAVAERPRAAGPQPGLSAPKATAVPHVPVEPVAGASASAAAPESAGAAAAAASAVSSGDAAAAAPAVALEVPRDATSATASKGVLEPHTAVSVPECSPASAPGRDADIAAALEPAAAAPTATEPIAQESMPTASRQRSWAAALFPSAHPPPPGPQAHRVPGRVPRQAQPWARGISSQPPEVMFLHHTTSHSRQSQAAAVHAGAPAQHKAAEDGRPPAVNPTSSPKPSGTALRSGTDSVLSAAQATTPGPSAVTAATAAHGCPSAERAAPAAADAQPAYSNSAAQQPALPVTSNAAVAAAADAAASATTGSSAAGGGVAQPSAPEPEIATADVAAVAPQQPPEPPAVDSRVGGAEPGAGKEGNVARGDDGDDATWHEVTTRQKTKAVRSADAGHAHSVAGGGAAAMGAGRTRGRHGDAAATVAAAPHQRSAGAPAPAHRPQSQGGRGRGAAPHAPQHGLQPSAAAAKPRAVAPGVPAAAPVEAAAVTAVSGSSPSVPLAGATAVGIGIAAPVTAVEAGGNAVPLTVPTPVACPVSEAAFPAAEASEATRSAATTTADMARQAAGPGEAAEAAVAPVAAAPSDREVAADVERQDVDEAAVEVEATVPESVAPAAPTDVHVGMPSTSGPVALVKEDDTSQHHTVPTGRDKEGEETARKAEDEEDDGAAAVPAGRNPWGLLGNAGEDGEATAEASSAASASAAASAIGTGVSALLAAATGGLKADLVEELQHLLMPATAEQLLAGSQQQQQPGNFRIEPRGLKNTGNTCFINATMQALLACAPFASVLSRLPAVAPLLDPRKSPTLHGLALFLAELVAPQPGASTLGAAAMAASGREETQQTAEDDGWAVPRSNKRGAQRRATTAKAVQQSSAPPPATLPSGSSTSGKGEPAGQMRVVLGGQPLVPSMLSGIAAAFNPRISIAEKQTMAKVLSKAVVEQEQQDAQEFFQFLVNGVHEEVVALRKAHGLAAAPEASTGAGGGDDEEWAQVGRKNKATVTRQVGTPADDASSRSPVTAIFTGQLKSTVRFQQPHAHYKPSATIEAFNMLHLDIAAEGVTTLEDALRHHSVPESIEYKPEGATEMLPAKKDVRLYRLPEVLVLHLKRFTYTAAGGGHYTKLQKPVAFTCTLRLEGKILAEDCPDRANSEYRIFATINHHGRSIAGGHYLADVQQPDGRWLRFNDEEVSLVPESEVLREKPYLLFYQRVVPPKAA